MLTKYIAIFASFIVGFFAIYKDWIKEKLGSRHKLILVSFLLISFIWSCYNISEGEKKLKNETTQKTADSVRMQKNFDTILTGLKTDTSELKKTNKILTSTRNELSDKLAKNSLTIADKISQSGTKLLGNLEELNNQITGGDGLLIFSWDINGKSRNYNAFIGNTSKYRLELLQMQVTNYDQLLLCKHENSLGTYKIDRTCWFSNTFFFPDTNSNRGPVMITPVGQTMMDYLMPRVIGLHKCEIQILLRNRTYIEQFVYRVNPNYSINQTLRLLDFTKEPYNVLKVIPSNDKAFNEFVKWDEFFSIPYRARIMYNLN